MGGRVLGLARRALGGLDRALQRLCDALRRHGPRRHGRRRDQGPAPDPRHPRRGRMAALVGRFQPPAMVDGTGAVLAPAARKLRLRRGRAGRTAQARRAWNQDRLQRRLRQADRPCGPERRPTDHHEGRRGHRRRRGRDQRQPHRGHRPARLGHRPCRRPRHGHGRQDHHPRPGGRPLARLDGLGRDHPAAVLGQLRRAGLRRDHHPRPVQ
ncbi:hypothetical protein D3C72_1127140 [compost metagenome]